MAPPGKDRVILYADQEHGGIRLVVFLGLIAGFLLGFRLMVLLLEAFAPPALLDYTTFLACVGALPLALIFIWVLEKVLKRVWHSGISFVLDDRGLFARDQRGVKKENRASNAQNNLVEYSYRPTMTWESSLGQLNWYFRLSGYSRGGRERRFPAKWYCMATELQQDDMRLSVFTFMPPEKATQLANQSNLHFLLISPAELYETGVRSRIGPPTRPSIPNKLLQSKEGRYWLAERRRWEHGIELTSEDFITLIDYAQLARRPEVAANLPTIY